MTEEEAKAKSCCGPADCGRAIDTDPAASPLGGAMRRVCEGSACMAWRARKIFVPNKRDAGSHEEDRFYCGLAGTP